MPREPQFAAPKPKKRKAKKQRQPRFASPFEAAKAATGKLKKSQTEVRHFGKDHKRHVGESSLMKSATTACIEHELEQKSEESMTVTRESLPIVVCKVSTEPLPLEECSRNMDTEMCDFTQKSNEGIGLRTALSLSGFCSDSQLSMPAVCQLDFGGSNSSLPRDRDDAASQSQSTSWLRKCDTALFASQQCGDYLTPSSQMCVAPNHEEMRAQLMQNRGIIVAAGRRRSFGAMAVDQMKRHSAATAPPPKSVVADSHFGACTERPMAACRNRLNFPEIEQNEFAFRVSEDCSSVSDSVKMKPKGRGKRSTLSEASGRMAAEFEVISELGKGSFGRVLRARRRVDGVEYAVKKLSSDKRASLTASSARKEGVALAGLQTHGCCAHVVRYFDMWFESHLEDVSKAFDLYLVTELCTMGTLESRLQLVHTHKTLATVLLHVSRALAFVHSAKMVHLDVKPENILITCDSNHSELFKLADFGLCMSLTHAYDEALATGSSERMATTTPDLDFGIEEGDRRYLSVELLEGRVSRENVSLYRCDMFALGATVYELMSAKRLPDGGIDWNTLRQGILEFSPTYAKVSLTEDSLIGAVKRCVSFLMRADPSQRPRASHVVATFSRLEQPALRAKDEELFACRQQMAQLQTRLRQVQRALALEKQKNGHKYVRCASPDSITTLW